MKVINGKGKVELISAQIITIWRNKKIVAYVPQKKRIGQKRT